MATLTTDAPSASPLITHLAHDKNQVQQYIIPYKSLRLYALLNFPAAFHSTYAREVAFPDSFWLERLTNPNAETFVALSPTSPSSPLETPESSSAILATATLMGPLPFSTTHLTVLGEAILHPTLEEVAKRGEKAHYRLNAVFTHPDARRKGLAKGVTEAAMQFVVEKVTAVAHDTYDKSSGVGGTRKDAPKVVISVIVELENAEARKLYERVGFVETLRIERNEEGKYLVNIAILEWRPPKPAEHNVVYN